jgi:hypothetical protein
MFLVLSQIQEGAKMHMMKLDRAGQPKNESPNIDSLHLIRILVDQFPFVWCVVDDL